MAHAFTSATAPSVTAPRDLPNRPALDSDIVREARIDLAACFRMAARLGLHEGICNHFSAMLPGYDDRIQPDRTGKRPVVERQDGETYGDLWLAAIKADPDWVFVVSFR